MPDPFKITVKTEIAVTGKSEIKIPAETVPIEVRAVCHTEEWVKPPDVKKGEDKGMVKRIPLMPPIEGQPLFLLVRPCFPDPKKTPFCGYVEYSTAKDCPEAQRKPLKGSHVFLNGQTEWVTDPLESPPAVSGKSSHHRGRPLQSLYFWNHLTPDTRTLSDAEREKAKEWDLTVAIQIIAGYQAVPDSTAECK